MRTIVIILIIVCWICSWNAALRAQTMLGIYQKQHLLPFAEPEAAVVRPVAELSVPAALPDFRVSAALQRRASFLFAQPESLLGDYYSDLTQRFLPPQVAGEKKPAVPTVNRRIFNTLYNARGADEKEIIRLQWQETFGVDVWFAYYKAREVEDWVKQRLSVKIGRLKGEPVVDRTRAFYTFKSRF